MVQMTLKGIIDHFQQDSNDPASALIEIEETIRIMSKKHSVEINLSLEWIEVSL